MPSTSAWPTDTSQHEQFRDSAACPVLMDCCVSGSMMAGPLDEARDRCDPVGGGQGADCLRRKMHPGTGSFSRCARSSLPLEPCMCMIVLQIIAAPLSAFAQLYLHNVSAPACARLFLLAISPQPWFQTLNPGTLAGPEQDCGAGARQPHITGACHLRRAGGH